MDAEKTVTIHEDLNFDDIVITMASDDYVVSDANVTVGAIGSSTVWDSNIAGLTMTGGASDSIGYDYHTLDLFGNTAQSSRVELKGDNADVVINGLSVMQTLQDLQQRLGLIVRNPELEDQWAELKILGQQYMALEAKCIEKNRMWKTLNDMPPPVIE